ncbi:MAG TPA: hypothetical protein VF624_13785 [Tepidisphaeraceae bacterium]
MLLSKPTRQAIREAAKRGMGQDRDRRGIVEAANRCGANPDAVLAAFGFLHDANQPKAFVDVLNGDEFTMALLPTEMETVAAFALSRAAHPAGCALVSAA